jgi:hypothetical protein
MSKPISKLVNYTSTAIFIAGGCLILYAGNKSNSETLSLILAGIGGFYFLAYGKIEEFVMRLEKSK